MKNRHCAKNRRFALLASAACAVCFPALSAQVVIFSEDFESFPANAIDTRSTETDLSKVSSWRSTDSSVQREASVRLDPDGLLGPAGENQFLQFNIIDITWTTLHADAANLMLYPTTALGLSFDFYEPTGGNGDAWIYLTQNHAHIEKPYSWLVKITLNDGTLSVEGRDTLVFENAYALDTAHSLAVFANNSSSPKTYTWEGAERVIESERIHLYLNGALLVENLIRNRNFIRNVTTSLNIALDAFTLQNAPAQEGNFPGQNIYYDNFVAYDLGGRLTFTYEGREADAPWRAEALARIDQNRKSPLPVQALGADGLPVEGARVGLSMTRHGFDFSTLVSSNTFLSDHPNYARYRRIVEHYFNGASDAGGTRWPAWVSVNHWQNWSQEKTIETYRWLKERGMNTRVLTTIYQGIHLPQFITDKFGTSAQGEIPADVDAHLEDIMGKLGPYVDEWEIINETAASRNLLDFFGEQIAVDWYSKANELVPDARLAINENSIVGGVRQWRSDFYFNQIKYLVDNGAPLHSIGMQGHHRTTEALTPPANLGAIYDRFATFGIPIAITEYDLETPDNLVQADYTRDFLIGTFAHPAVESFLIFGIWAGEHWRPSAAMFNLDWSPKPQFHAYHDLVHRDWWTRLAGSTGELGNFTGSGFHGSYRVLAMDGARYGSTTVSLEAAPADQPVHSAVVPMRHTAVFPSDGAYGRVLAKADFSGADLVSAGRIGTVGYQGDDRVWHSFLHFPLGQGGLSVDAIAAADRVVFRTGAWSKTLSGAEDILGGADVAVWVALQAAPVTNSFASSFDFANIPGAREVARLHKESIRVLPDEDSDRVVEPVLLDIEIDLTDVLADALATGALANGKALTIGLLPADAAYFDADSVNYNAGSPAYKPQRNVTFSLSSSFIGLERDASGLFASCPWLSARTRSTWMGTVDVSSSPRLLSDVLGWIWQGEPASDAALTFFDFALSRWAFTSAAAFPWVYYHGDGAQSGWKHLAHRTGEASWYYVPLSGWLKIAH